ncbi:PA2169 family four-helix-bundle protein [Cereibacter sphaeroides]|uniref:ferritin-like domain-containing protein n=1 Tax=Cereibacter sphaeroides TaxID=1063 RepID=UPI001F3E15E7|nr:PA2169 family four-helix-bundle protein [Cereibacter sphaeroides]MCE6960989.1 PA2169 family four-helix-bundle protein [Cereibacter sphaeroides]MCE6969713.1 PA2169 family four-helix-bundle protein [Cereibacter sphaeroides]MCE6975188.1 PA2169 family four-helix-bundle protein [Cereibacter sphaeroides]
MRGIRSYGAPEPAALKALETLHLRSIDVLAGFETMVGRAELEFRPVAERFRDLHREQAEELAAMIARFGREPEVDGSLMSTVNRAVVSLRSMINGIDGSILDQIQDGEQHVIDAFDDALGAGQPIDVTARLRSMRRELSLLLFETQAAATGR